MTTDQIVLILLIVFATSVVQSLVGFGFALLAVPLMIIVIDLQSAVIVSSIVGSLSNLLQCWQLTLRFIAISPGFVILFFI